MNGLQHSLVFALRGYQRVVSPALMGIFGPLARCRFEPSCSEYAIQAVREHGAIKGVVLAAWRLCRCNPWGGCGHDPVPREFQISNLKFQVGNRFRQSERSVPGEFEISNLKFEMRKAPEMREAQRG